ncbi:MAG: hypothetical protein JO001_14160 [Alphaproteobacteria bacterium]|nr:hypothetical protein [Alphaproteobacteria bacterium]
MPELNWNIFEGLAGAPTNNFEMLCRAIIRRQYGQFGDFRALANQPGVEFHLKLKSACALGEAGRWFGWQCRWYDLPSGTDIAAARRSHIKQAIETTERVLPEITDWVLWTRQVLTRRDQEWFYGLKTKMKLALWSEVEAEDLLSGPAAILRESYFGELVLAPDELKTLHDKSVEPIRQRWLPEVHQVVEAERVLHRSLGEIEAWSNLGEIREQLGEDIAGLVGFLSGSEEPIRRRLLQLLESAKSASLTLGQCEDSLREGKYEVLPQIFSSNISPTADERGLIRQLRATRDQAALFGANTLADMQRGQHAIQALRRNIRRRLLFVTADAGCGKTQLAAQLTAPTPRRPAGILLRGKFLSAGKSLDDLAARIVIRGRAVSSFEALIAAIDAAGQRHNARLPIIIDGLNEAEDPRDWKDQLASLPITLTNYEHVQLICTLRSAFYEEAVPDNSDTLEIPGFEEDLAEAGRRYFAYYKIDPRDGEFPLEFLNHPLTLRIFCEVTNPDRKELVGAAAVPGSLAVLFERYLRQVGERIKELSPAACRFFPADIAQALNKIGLLLWTTQSRDIEIQQLRRELHDEYRPWNHSLVAALEHDGILFREPGAEPGHGKMSVIYDAIAGHMIANALLAEYPGDRFDIWIQKFETLLALGAEVGGQPPEARKHHPLAYDVLQALVGLMPRRMNGKQLWPLLEGRMRANALWESAFLDNAHLDQETVAQLAPTIRARAVRRRDLFYRLFVTRAAHAHPLNADFLDTVLRPMPMADRDLRWSEWLRNDQSVVNGDLLALERRWKDGRIIERADQLRARWVMWTLTSTMRGFRDHATCALYHFGRHEPEALFNLAIESLDVNDPYVPERMLASCYGVAMGLWADPNGSKLRDALPLFAGRLADEMFVAGAPHSTYHALTRGYALGVITLAQKVAPSCISQSKRPFLTGPFSHLPSPFRRVDEVTDAELASADRAMQMDFANYTLGRLVPDRSNYDDKHIGYRNMRRQIAGRMADLGYAASQFSNIDNIVGRESWHSERQGKTKVDRYGKKYSWIAFFEMYGVRFDAGILSEHRDERPSDVDIDPSFPESPKTLQPALGDLFSGSPTEPREWLSKGPTPDYQGLLQIKEIDGEIGPWVLLDGYVEETSSLADRRVYTFLRGILANRRSVKKITDAFNDLGYPGNRAIPETRDDYYTYAGEIPWSRHFAADLREPDGRAKPDYQRAFSIYDGKRWLPGIQIEVPACGFAWESYHSELNQVGGVIVLAPALSETLGLSNRLGEWDLYDQSGRLATAYREFKGPNDTFRSKLLYLRADLMRVYLSPKSDLVWLVWGERNFSFKNIRVEQVRDAFVGHAHIHRYSSRWLPPS